MHPALFIDEIVRVIFAFSAEEKHSALCQLARCCRAWKDPALDNLWRRLACAAPLFRLIPGVVERDGIFTLQAGRTVGADELALFESYAIRVKSITHRHRRPIDPLIISLLQNTVSAGNNFVLPRLTKVQIGVPSWDALATTFGLSHELRHLTLDLGFNKARTDAKGWSNDSVAAGYLERVIRVAPSLHRLDIRGLALGCERINRALTSMMSLRVLTLSTGKSLTADTLAAIITFPHLIELEFHAGHIDANELAESMLVHSAPLFPVLRKLRVRAQAPLVEILLRVMPSDTLESLFIEAEQPTQSPSTWASAFTLIPTKATNTLHELTVEHHTDLNSTNFNFTSHPNSIEATTQFTLATLRPLARLPHLRRFVLDATVPPDLCNTDIEEIAKWWPLVEHLDLGGLLSPVDCPEQAWKSRTTLSALECLARSCPMLDVLVINLDIGSGTETDSAGVNVNVNAIGHSLRSLVVGVTSAPDVWRLSCYLRQVFPSLQEIDGVATYEEEWKAVQCMLHASQTMTLNT